LAASGERCGCAAECPQVTLVINPVGSRYFPPGPLLLSQLEEITAPWLYSRAHHQ